MSIVAPVRGSAPWLAAFCAGLGLVFLAAGCTGACDKLVQRYCACDPSFAENQRGCSHAKDASLRAAAEAKAKARGKTLDQLCRAKLESFECPERAVPEFYPGGFSLDH